jgi:hypothetical protein
MENRFGLDDRYFKEKLEQLVRDVSNYTPREMSLALQRLKEVADNQRVVFAKKNRPTVQLQNTSVTDT